MTLDHHDEESVDAFVDDVDRTLSEAAPGFQEWTLRLIGCWVAGGLVMTGGVRADGGLSTVLYVVAIAILVVWVVGFYRARGERARWFNS